MKPLISILMPVRNCAETLALAVQSIVVQTCDAWELLVIDDGSTDRTVEIAIKAQDSRIRVIADARGNLGLAARLNQGITLAEGRYIARMDGDDISYPQRLERELECLESQPGTDLVGCGMVIFKDGGRMVGVQRARSSHAEICGNSLRSCLLPHATWMGRAEWFRRHRYCSKNRRAEDRELLLRSRDVSCFSGIPDLLYGYRVNRVSIRKNARARFEYLSAVTADARKRGHWRRYFAAAGAEIAKLGIDTLALATHTDRILLQHRASSPKSPQVVAEWDSLWRCLNGATAGGPR
ncbi:glycosyltransferase family 2 protein [Candidatus Korobacter versatilis]|nr:glycosyltransferase [Candidatus Koribacter versatilis]